MATAADFDGVLAPHWREGGPGAAVAARRRGELIHARGYGLANLEWRQPIDADTVFRIGSITKQFTAAAIMKLAEAGALDLDDPIERHLPDYPAGARRITVRQLLNHTSGIKSVTGLPEWRDLMTRALVMADMIGVFKDLPLDFEPGERFVYNNSGYILLGAIIERLTGQTYGEHLRQTFFEPLGMSGSSYLHDRPVTPRRAAGYERRGREIFNAAPIEMSWPHGAGALGSTITDLLRWTRALHAGEVVSPASFAAMTTPTVLSDGTRVNYGFGLRLLDYRGRRHIGHTGGINGFVSNLVHWPDEDLTIVVLSNLVPFATEQVTYGLARRVLALPDATGAAAVALGEAQLAACAGLYKDGPAQLGLRVEAGVLIGDWPAPGARFRPIAADRFSPEKDPEVALRFSDLAEGAYRQVTIEGYGDPMTLKRAPAGAEAAAS